MKHRSRAARKNSATLVYPGVAVAAVLALTACLQGESSDAEIDPSLFEDPSSGEAPADSLEGVTMSFVSWGGGFQDGQEEAFFSFGDVTGAELQSDGPTDQAQLQAQVEADNVYWDVVNSSPTYNSAYCGELYLELDYDLLDMSAYPDTLPSGDCYIASIVYGYGIYYDYEVYGDDGPQGWEDFFDTEAFPGTRGVDGRATPTVGTLEAALLADGVAEEDLYPLDTDRAIEKWESIDDDLAFWSSGAEQTQQAQGGEADMIMAWSGRIYEANTSGANFVPVWEDSFLLSDSFSIAKGTDNPEAAHAFINYAIGAEQQELMAELTSYSPVNENSEPDFDEMGQEFDVSDPEIMDQAAVVDPDYTGDNMEEISDIWQDFLN